ELKALRAHPRWHGEIDRDSLALFLRHGYIPAPRSIYRDVRKVLPGTHVTFIADDTPPREVCYWSVRDAAERGAQDPVAGDPDELVDAFERELQRTVREEMVADVPLGAFLSGGVDSSTIVALMQRQSSRPVKTFTIGFHEREYDEAAHAKAIAAHLGTDHTEL